MNDELLEFLGSFQSKLETLFPNKLYADKLLTAVANGNLSLISTNLEISLDDYQNLALEIDSRIKSLHSINKNPRRFLRSEEMVRPVELSKNINNRTIYELSKNSHNWKRKRIASVEPTHLLTEVNEDDLKLYENKVYKTALDRSYQNLHYYNQELQKMINDRRSAVQIDKGYQSGYKGAKLFRKIAPNNIDNLNKLDESFLMSTLNYIDEVTKKVQLLQRGNLYYDLRKEKPIKSPLNKTNILMKDKDYFSIWELWKKIDEDEYRRGEIAQENDSSHDKPENIYFTYVFVNLVIVLLNDGYTAVKNYLGNHKKRELFFEAEDDYTRITFKASNFHIRGKISEIGSKRIVIKNNEQKEFLISSKLCEAMKFENSVLTVKKSVKQKHIQRLKEDFAKFIKDKYKKDFEKKGAARAKQKVFNEKNEMKKSVLDILTIFINKTQIVDFSINVLAEELPGTNMELESIIETLNAKYCNPYDLIVYPGIDRVDGIQLSEKNTYLSNTLGENIKSQWGNDVVKKFGNYSFQMFSLVPNNLSCINRISRFFNILKYRFDNYKESLETYCPSCGEKAVHKKNETDYTCYKCRSIWSYSNCKKCNYNYLYLELEDKEYIAQDSFGSLQSYLDYLEIYRGTLALTNIDIENAYKTICPKCGQS